MGELSFRTSLFDRDVCVDENAEERVFADVDCDDESFHVVEVTDVSLSLRVFCSAFAFARNSSILRPFLNNGIPVRIVTTLKTELTKKVPLTLLLRVVIFQ